MLRNDNVGAPSKGQRSDSHLWSGRPRRPLERTVEVPTGAVPRSETGWLRQTAYPVTGILLWRRPADWAARRWGLCIIHGLACRTNADSDGGAQRTRHLDRSIALRTVVDDANRGVNKAILHRLGCRSELTDSDVEFSIDYIIRRPRVPSRRPVVKKMSAARREAKHR